MPVSTARHKAAGLNQTDICGDAPVPWMGGGTGAIARRPGECGSHRAVNTCTARMCLAGGAFPEIACVSQGHFEQLLHRAAFRIRRPARVVGVATAGKLP
jgi:hypothetical protein